MKTEPRLHDRALEPVAQCLMRHLMVPNVYLTVRWPNRSGRPVDVLAIDRAGQGDPHIVEIKESLPEALDTIALLFNAPAAYRWLALPAAGIGPRVVKRLLDSGRLYPPSGSGRVGLMQLTRTPDDDLAASILVRAERFHGSYFPLADKFTQRHEPAFRY